MEKLNKKLAKMKYPESSLKMADVQDRDPFIFLQILHFVMVNYNSQFYLEMLGKKYNLLALNDKAFLESVYKLMIQEFNYKPAVSIDQFSIQGAYVEQKVIMMVNVIERIKQRYAEKDHTRQAPKPNKQSRGGKSFAREADELESARCEIE